MVAVYLTVLCFTAWGQTDCGARYAISALDLYGRVLPEEQRTTNFNPSLCLDDKSLSIVLDSMRTDGTATIITVYETDADDEVGLWQLGSGSNRALWLNSQSASYDDFSVRYRSTTERGVVIHSMAYRYPSVESTYNGHDTLMLGLEGSNMGKKNLCMMLYFPGVLPGDKQRRLESVLAVRYGALLHGPYIDRNMYTLWDTKESDSAYSHGVCGIGRDVEFGLYQPKSMIRGDILTIATADSLADLDYVMLGSDGNALSLDGETVYEDGRRYSSVARRWKLRAHTDAASTEVNILADLELPADRVRLMLSSDEETKVLTPERGSLQFVDIEVRSGVDYILTLLVDEDKNEDQNENEDQNGSFAASSGGTVSVMPNPTTGKFTLDVLQDEEAEVEVRILDVNGRTVEHFTTDEKVSQYSYDGKLQASGIYYVTVSSNGCQKTIKLIVVR